MSSTSRYVLSCLGILAAISIGAAFFGWLPYTALDLSLSLIILLFTTQTANALCALYTKATPTTDSAYITALILFFVLTPLQSSTDALIFIAAGALAMISKYVLAWRKVHFFNPAAVAVLAVWAAGTGLVSWWVGTTVLLPFVLVLGFLIARRVRSLEMVRAFVVTSLLVFVAHFFAFSLSGDLSSLQTLIPKLIQFISGTPLMFLAFFVLTDPQTAPSSKSNRTVYSLLSGALFVFVPAQIAVLSGNAVAFVLENYKKRRVSFTFHKAVELSKNVYEYSFVPKKSFVFIPGQYMEWSLPHASADSRGTRRAFAITSAPSEPFIRFCTDMPVESSTFKDALRDMKKGSQIFATGPLGDFGLPKDPSQKILAIAGGLGIAPFISMFRHLSAQRERRDIVLICSATTPLDFVYQKEIDSFKDSIGLRVIYLPLDFTELSDWAGESGPVTSEFIQKEVRDFKKRCWYLSGSDVQVEEYTWLASALGVSKETICYPH
jgi:ferredoxin-NADP reductase/Na+-translocating ferredoxin:NAD+ oxidoreductase RnfD subunit